MLPHETERGDHDFCPSRSHYTETPTQPVGSGWPQRESCPRSPHQESRALPTEIPRTPSNSGNSHVVVVKVVVAVVVVLIVAVLIVVVVIVVVIVVAERIE